MVVTCLPSARDSGATQDRMAFPSSVPRCMHRTAPSRMPNFVPIISSESRRTHSKGGRGVDVDLHWFSIYEKLVMWSLPPLFLDTGLGFWVWMELPRVCYNFLEQPAARLVVKGFFHPVGYDLR